MTSCRFSLLFFLLKLSAKMPKNIVISGEICLQLEHFEVRLHTLFEQLMILYLHFFPALHFLSNASNELGTFVVEQGIFLLGHLLLPSRLVLLLCLLSLR